MILRHIPSTHTALSQSPDMVAPMQYLRAVSQSAGRGQRGNAWEAEPGRNLTFSLLLSPVGIRPAEQFVISEAFALAFVDLLDEYGISATIKWPNDIYAGDRKICGILIEHSLCGPTISHSILSAGLNVNQTRFLSDAPNPVSMSMITGREYDLETVMARLHELIVRRTEEMRNELTEPKKTRIHREFMKHLYRGDGQFYPFRDNLADETISAAIEDVAPDGRLTLRLADDSPRTYLFKEVSFLP